MFDELHPTTLFSLKNRVALITGAAGGIAGGIIGAFAAAGARLILADRNESVKERAEALKQAGIDARPLVFDVTDRQSVAAAIADVAEHSQHLDIVVNNAGVIVRTPFLQLTDEEWTQVIDTNISGYFVVAQEAARVMVSQRRGRIINIGSIMGRVARPNLVPYVSAKGAVHTFTQAVAADLADTGITINTIAPGYTETEFSQASVKEFHDFVQDWTPVRRWGKPEDIAGVALLLASDAGSYINGQVIYVDGGFTAVTK